MAGERALPGLGLFGFWTLGSNGYKPQMDENLRKLSALVMPYVLSSVPTVPGSPTDGDIHRLTSAPNLNAIAIRDNGGWVYLTPGEGWQIYDRGANERLLFDGTNWVNLASAGNFLALTDTPSSYTGHALKLIRVKADLSGLEFFASSGGGIISGPAAPTAGQGNDNDFYIETTNSRLYGPKAAGAWPGSYTSLVGLDGADFPPLTITSTAADLTLTNGHFTGNQYLDVDSASPVTLTLNTGLTGTEPMMIEQKGVGQITIAGSATLRTRNGLKSAGRYAVLTIIPKGGDVYTIGGDTIT